MANTSSWRTYCCYVFMTSMLFFGSTGVQTNVAGRIILAVSTRKLIVNGTDPYLAYIMDLNESRKDISQVLIVKEFSDVFLEELPNIPPDRELEFWIKDGAIGVERAKEPAIRSSKQRIYTTKCFTLRRTNFVREEERWDSLIMHR
ncbi:zf-CCHC domain-containing protein/RVP_2 domain-containing protein [Gossypium australe]|uniref:Zf-CCHC domain-containing protein/RVP_2 domain-containing protein n=1 Tax=Gossypium australe TaxID=47621 RepID=A0A5B6WFC6_9ROSI|nr:zf-CCHC domain-containing protein/RVP_2 domain-containing protein [Gossypium australe]